MEENEGQDGIEGQDEGHEESDFLGEFANDLLSDIPDEEDVGIW
jgi:hypothetical protein